MPSGSNSIVRNALFGFSTLVLPLGLSFIATPIIVGALGHKDYGIYALVLGFVGYSFNFGTGRSITKYLAQFRADGTSEKATEVISATLTLNLIIGVLGALIIAGLSGWLVESVFLIEESARERTVYAFYICGLIIFMTLMSQVGSSVLQGVHRFDLYSRLFNANSIAIMAGNLVLALYGFGLLWLLGWNLVALTITSIAGMIIASRIVPEFKIRLAYSRAAIYTSVGFSIWIVGYQILGNVLLLFERGWIMRKLGPEALTFYVVPLTIGFYIHSSISSLMIVLFPLASEFKGDRPKLERLYRKATKVTCMLVCFIVVTLVVQSTVFLGLWMGPEFAEASGTLLVIHAISFGFLALLIVAWQMADGLGHPAYNFLILAVCLIISMTGMIITIEGFGNRGVAFSRLTGFAVMMLSIIYSEKWFFGRFGTGFWGKMLLALAPASAFAALTQYLLVNNLEASWFVLAGAAAAGAIVYGAVLLAFGFISEDEKILLRRVMQA